MTKKILSILLIITLSVSLFPTSVIADDLVSSIEMPIVSAEYTAETSLGTLITRTLENSEGDTQFPGVIRDIIVTGNIATVSLSTEREAELVVALYPDSETDVQLLASGKTTASRGRMNVDVVLDTTAMPEYYIIAAYLLDADTYEPISDSFISRYYTAEFQAFLQKTTDDFNPELVLNLDDNSNNNYLVFDESVLRISATPGVNEIIDHGDGTYTIQNADERVRALQPGDAFAYTYSDGTLLIVVAATVTANGTTITVVENTEATLEMVFRYIKIDTASIPGAGNVDMSEENTNVECQSVSTAILETYEASGDPYYKNEEDPIVTDIGENSIRLGEDENVEIDLVFAMLNIDETMGTSFKFKFDPVPDSSDPTSIVFDGSLTFNVSAGVKIYKSGSWFSSVTTIDYSAEIEAEIGGELGGEIELGKEITLPMAATGVKVSFPLYFVYEVEGNYSISGELKGTLGMSYDTDYGFHNLTSWPSFETQAEFSGKLKIGFKVDVACSCIIKKLVMTSLSSEIGAELSGKIKGNQFEEPKDSQVHDCQKCIKGDVKIYGNITVNFEALWGIIKSSRTLLDVDIKVSDFFHSFDYDESGWRTCPHISYKVTAEVYDEEGNRLDNAVLMYQGANLGVTDENAKVSFFLPNGTYELEVKHDNLIGLKTITVEDSQKNVRIVLDTDIAVHGQILEHGKCGDLLSWARHSDATLIIKGTGLMYNYGPEENLENPPWYENRNMITSVIIKEGATSIGSRAFANCAFMTSITIPEGIESIGDKAFSDCTKVTAIEIPISVSTIGSYAFAACNGLTNIIIPEGVTIINKRLFENSSNLVNIALPPNVTEIREGAFFGCSRMSTITLPDGLRAIEARAFFNCRSLSAVKVPDSVTEIDQDAFGYCKQLATVELPNSLTAISAYLFEGCENLGNVVIPRGVASIGSYAFSYCSTLEHITIPNGVVNIDTGTFANSGLTSVVIPGSVTTIGYNAFQKCNSLQDVYYGAGPVNWQAISISSNNELLTNANIHYNSVEPATGLTYIASKPLTVKLLASFTGETEMNEEIRYASFNGLKPAAPYIMIVTVDEQTGDFLNSDNLLYIAQASADENGTLTMSFSPRVDTVGTIRLYGASPYDLADATITIEQYTDGEFKVSVLYEDVSLTEGEDYVLKFQEEGLSVLATVTGKGDYSGKQTVEGERLATTVFYEANGGSGIQDRDIKRVGEELLLPIPERTGWIFRGWTEVYSSETPEYLPNSFYSADKNVRLYAIWGLPVPDCILPASLDRLDAEALFGCTFSCIYVSDGTTYIGERAFSGNDHLLYVFLPASVTQIEDNAFEGLSGIMIYGETGTAAETCAKANDFAFIRLEGK